MIWLAFAFAFQLGMIPNEGFILYDPPIERLFEQSIYIDAAVELQMLNNHVFVGGEVKTYVWPCQWNDWWPFRHDYTFSAGLRWSFVELGFNHVCLHPSTQYRMLIKPGVEGAYEELYIRFSGKIGGTK